MKSPSYSIHINSDNSLLICFEENKSLELSEFIHSFNLEIPKLNLNGFIESVPAYQSVLVIFNVSEWKPQDCIRKLDDALKTFKSSLSAEPSLIEIPVCYDSRVAQDLNEFCDLKRLSIKELIESHTAIQYRVEMLGFLPGFLYLSGLKPELHMPRKTTPELKIPAGSVAIGGDQTGVYPIDSPGGWHIIGKTPTTMFNPTRDYPAIAKPMDLLKFVAISYEEYLNYEL